jgi:CheY-like chemotaxis protein
LKSDPEGRSFLRGTLSTSEYLLTETTTATAGLRQIEASSPDAILLDPALPDMDGLDVIRQVRLLNYMFPIIVLSDNARELDKVTALDAARMISWKNLLGLENSWRGFALRCAESHLLPRETTTPFFRPGDCL